MLTGKCKENFIDWWYLTKRDKEFGACFDGYSKRPQHVFNIPFSMAYGVYIDFFRQHGKIWVEILSATHENHFLKFLGEDIMSPFFEFINPLEVEGTYEEARQKAIEKANEIYNTHGTNH